MDTKTHILECAKELFISNGYSKTTTRMIAQKADVNLGLLPYYFGKKENIGSEIYTYYADKFFSECKNCDLPHNSIEKLLYVYLFVQYKMDTEKGFIKMYAELLDEDVLRYSSGRYTKDFFRGIAKEYDLSVSDEDIEVTFTIIKGLERSMMLAIRDGILDATLYDYNVKLAEIGLLDLGLDRKTIREHFENVRKRLIEDKIDFSMFRFENTL